MVRIANLSYDTYFKYLMEDTMAARVLLSALLRRKVVSLTQMRNEISSVTKESDGVELNMLRLDFGAVILDEKGERRSVHIELQKTRGEGDAMQFSQYIGPHYQDMSLADDDGKAIPLIEIYILGHNLPDVKIDEAVLYAKPQLTNVHNEPIPFEGSSEYIDGLTHSLIIVQLPKVKNVKKEGSILNVLLSFFAYNDNSKTIEVPEAESYSLEDKESLEVRLVQLRLENAVGAKELMRDIDLELEVQRELVKRIEEKRKFEQMAREKAEVEKENQEMERKNQELTRKKAEVEKENQEIERKNQELTREKAEVERKNAEIERKNQEMAEMMERERQEREKEREEKEKAEQEREKAMAVAIRALYATGKGVDEIAGMLGVKREDVEMIVG